MSILKGVLLSSENLNFNKCTVSRVFNRNDKDKSPILFVYIDSDELGKKFYYADKNQGQFIELPQEEFISQFECYEADLQQSNGVRPWEHIEQPEEIIDLSRSSGTIVAQEGNEI